MKYNIRDREWEGILDILKKIYTGNKYSLRCFVEAFCYMARSEANGDYCQNITGISGLSMQDLNTGTVANPPIIIS